MTGFMERLYSERLRSCPPAYFSATWGVSWFSPEVIPSFCSRF